VTRDRRGKRALPASRSASVFRAIAPGRRGLFAVGGALIAGLAGLLIHRYLPGELLVLCLPLAFWGGMVLGRTFAVRVPAAGAAEASVPMERAAAVFDAYSIAPPRVAGVESPPPVAGVERTTAELNDYHLFTDILRKQLLSVTDLSEDAAKGILESLSEVDAQITGLLGFIQRSGSDQQATEAVSQIELQMKGCRELLDTFAARQRQAAQEGHDQRSKMMAETASVLKVIEGVGNIARQTNILSLNVSIEAARVGQAGKGFSVIAQEIRRLATEAQSLSVDVHNKVEGLIKIITTDMKTAAELKERRDADSIGDISSELTDLTGNLVSMLTHQRSVINKIETENESIARPIMDMMGKMQFQDIIRQQLGQLISTATMVDEHVQHVSRCLNDPADDVGLTLEQKLDDVFGGYVMERQRETHLSARGQAAARTPVALIELF
jgi:methyl-accepting chemotaxis protein